MNTVNMNTRVDNGQVRTIKKGRGRPPKIVATSLSQVEVSQVITKGKSPIKIAPRPGLVITPQPLVLGFLPRKHTTKKKKPPSASIDEKKTKLANKKLTDQQTTNKDKNDHRTEEQRRKNRINLLIQNLGNLLFGIEGEDQTKRTILEKAFDYIHQREKNPNQSQSSSKEQNLITKIKDLEASIIVLLNILKENNIQAPDGFADLVDSELCKASSDQTAVGSCNLPQVSESDNKSYPLHIHLVLPSLSQVKTSTIITLTATAPTMSTISTVASKTDQVVKKIPIVNVFTNTQDNQKSNQDQDAVITSEKNEIDFQRNENTSTTGFHMEKTTVTSSLVLPSSQNSITEAIPVEKKDLQVTPSASSESKSFSSTKSTSVSLTATTAKSSTQNFGIDRILVSNLNDIKNESIKSPPTTPTAAKTCETKNQPTTTTKFISINTTSKSSDKRTRLPSSGHTVAALLDSGTSSKPNPKISESVKKNKTPAKDSSNPSSAKTVKEKTLKKLKSCVSQNVSASQNLNAKPTTVANTTPGSRWGSFVENAAQNSDKYLLSSFTLSTSSKRLNSKRTSKPPNESTKIHKEPPKQSSNAKPISVLSPNSSNTSISATSSTTISSQINSILTSNRLKNVVMSSSNQVITNTSVSTTTTAKVPDKKATIFSPLPFPDVKSTESNEPKSTLISTLAKITTTTKQSKVISSTYSSSEIRPPDSTNTNTELTYLVPQMTLSLQTSKSANQSTHAHPSHQSNKMIRTMKDRTIKNKWLTATTKVEKTTVTAEAAIAPSLKISTPECVVDQCASPVISYPNTGKRKRKLTLNSNYKQPSSNTDSLSRKTTTALTGGTNNATVAASSKIFSAESLSRSSNSRGGKKPRNNDSKILPNTTTTLTKKEKTVSNQRKSVPTPSSHQRVQISNDFVNVSTNSLPTILNIFAPAPVPTSQLNQQQTLPSAAFSNFSAETLAGGGNDIMDGSTFSENNFSENMLMAANSQLFTNFSADSLIGGGSESQVPFAHMNQPNTNWNQPWLPQDMNEALFQSNFAGMRPQNRQMMQATTECSPIKSIMSILNSGAATNNASNFQFDTNSTEQGNQMQQNVYQQHHHQIQQSLQQNQLNRQQQTLQTQQQQNFQQNQQMENLPRAAMRINFNGTETANNDFIHPWLVNKSNPDIQRNTNNSNMSGQGWSNFQMMHNQMIRMPFKDGSNINTIHNNFNLNTNDKLVTKGRGGTGPSGPTGPMFGNTSLVNSNPQS